MIKIDTTELDKKISDHDLCMIQIAGEIIELRNKNTEQDKTIQILKDKIEILQTQILHDSKTLLDSIKGFFGIKPTRLKETTIIEP